MIEGPGVLNKEASVAYQNLSHSEKEQLKQQIEQTMSEERRMTKKDVINQGEKLTTGKKHALCEHNLPISGFLQILICTGAPKPLLSICTGAPKPLLSICTGAPKTFTQSSYWSTQNLYPVFVLEHPKPLPSIRTGAPKTFVQYLYWSTQTFTQYLYWSTENLCPVFVLEHPKPLSSICTGAPKTFVQYSYWSTQNLYPVFVLEHPNLYPVFVLEHPKLCVVENPKPCDVSYSSWTPNQLYE